MAIGGVNYASPVSVNGYSCANCAEVDLAAKGIDPKHPKSGAFDRDAAADATRQPFNPIKLAAVRRHAATVIGYSATGAATQPVSAGAAFSLVA